MEQVSAIQLKGITKRFGSVVANDGIDLEVKRGRSSPCWGERKRQDHPDEHDLRHLLPRRGHICVGGRRSPSAPPRTPTPWASA
ncbi:MAG: hypothetical protein ACLRIS_12325 [Flavonifractor plautii]